jgi:hypothetical protein
MLPPVPVMTHTFPDSRLEVLGLALLSTSHEIVASKRHDRILESLVVT